MDGSQFGRNEPMPAWDEETGGPTPPDRETSIRVEDLGDGHATLTLTVSWPLALQVLELLSQPDRGAP
ncbi:MAG TPA: hypothetical protein VIL09_17550 [Microvirga sp.]|jgi:hypothetical protein